MMKFDAVLIAGPTASGKSAAALDLARAYRRRADQCRCHAGLSRSAHPDRAARRSCARESAASALWPCPGARPLFGGTLCSKMRAAALARSARDGQGAHLCGRHGDVFHRADAKDWRIFRPCRQMSANRPARCWMRSACAHCMRGFARAIRRRLPRFAPPIRSVWCAPGKCWKRPAVPCSNGARSTAAPLLEGMNWPALCSIRRARCCAHRIAERFETMLDQGGVEEARALSGLDPALPAAKLLGLRPLQAHAEGAISRRGRDRPRRSPRRGNSPSAR